ncbi:hypothetical protein ES703_114507 [subsurface metagenome]
MAPRITDSQNLLGAGPLHGASHRYETGLYGRTLRILELLRGDRVLLDEVPLIIPDVEPLLHERRPRPRTNVGDVVTLGNNPGIRTRCDVLPEIHVDVVGVVVHVNHLILVPDAVVEGVPGDWQARPPGDK